MLAPPPAMDCYSEAGSFHGSGVEAASRWDCNRELRVLRDATTRSHAEEASALRRSAEEYERCALRCNMDESVALHNFLAGLHEAMEVRLERQRQHCVGRFEALEQRLDLEAGRLERLRTDIAAEARQAAQDAVQKLEQCVEQCVEGFGAGAETPMGGMAKVGADLKAAAESAAREIAAQVAGAACAGLRGELAPQTLQWQEEVQAVAQRTLTAEECSAATINAVKAAERQLEDLHAVVTQCPRVTDLAAVEQRALAGLDSVEAATTTLRSSLEVAEDRAQRSSLDLQSEIAYCENEMFAVTRGCRAMTESVESTSRQTAQRCTEDLACEFGAELTAMNGLLKSSVQRLEEHCQDETRSMCEARRNVEELCAEMDEVVGSTVKTAVGATHTLVTDLQEDLCSVRQDLMTTQHLAIKHGDDASNGCMQLWNQLENLASKSCLESLEGEVEQLRAKAKHLGEECAQASRHADSAWRPESAQLAAELGELRHDLAAASDRWKVSCKDSALTVETLSTDFGKLSLEVTQLQQRGFSHEWLIPKCMQRLQYLSMDSDAGVWLDSPEFSLGCLGPLVLRLYPRGMSRSDTQSCAVGLHTPSTNSAKGTAVPLRLDLSLAGLARRAQAVLEDSGGILWMATGFGNLADLVGGGEDLTVGVEVPMVPWATVGELKRMESPAPAMKELTSPTRQPFATLPPFPGPAVASAAANAGAAPSSTATTAPSAAAAVSAAASAAAALSAALSAVQDVERGAASREPSVAVPRGNSTGELFAAVPRGNTQGEPFAAVPRGNSQGEALAAVPRGNSQGEPFAAVPRANSQGEALAAVPRGNSQGDPPVSVVSRANSVDVEPKAEPPTREAKGPDLGPREAAPWSSPDGKSFSARVLDIDEISNGSRAGVPRPSSTSRLPVRPEVRPHVTVAPPRSMDGQRRVSTPSTWVPASGGPCATSALRTGWTLFGNEPRGAEQAPIERANSMADEERVSLREDYTAPAPSPARQPDLDSPAGDRTWVAELRQALGSIDAAAAARGGGGSSVATGATSVPLPPTVRGVESAPSTPLSRYRPYSSTTPFERRLTSTNPFDM